MKKVSGIMLFFLFACHSTDDNTIYFLNEGLRNCNSQISEFNDMFYTNIEVATLANPSKNRTYKIKADSLKIKSEYILDTIEKIISERRSIDSLKEIPEINLTLSISEYIKLLDDLFPNNLYLKEKTRKLTSSNAYTIKNYHEPGLEISANKIQAINHTALSFIAHKMQEPEYHPNKTEAIVIPKSYYVNYGEEFVANIYLVSYDSTSSNITIEVEGKPLAIHNGKATFIDTTKNKTGSINKNGLIRLKVPWSDYSNEFPFIIHYGIK